VRIDRDSGAHARSRFDQFVETTAPFILVKSLNGLIGGKAEEQMSPISLAPRNGRLLGSAHPISVPHGSVAVSLNSWVRVRPA
jgi:hypothetical protein